MITDIDNYMFDTDDITLAEKGKSKIIRIGTETKDGSAYAIYSIIKIVFKNGYTQTIDFDEENERNDAFNKLKNKMTE